MSESGKQEPTFWVTGWLGNGVKVSFTVPTSADGKEAYQHAFMFTSDLLASGMLLNAPGLEAGEESDLITVVMRREKSDGTPIIDFFAAQGLFKQVHKYLDSDADVSEFLHYSGFRSLNDIPLFDSQSPLKRTQGKKHAKETAVPTPFKVVRKQGAEKKSSDGEMYRPWELVRYEYAQPQAQPRPQSPAPQAKPDALKQEAASLGATVTDIEDTPKPTGVWSFDFNKLVFACKDIEPISQKRYNTVKKMMDEGAFKDCISLENAVQLVTARLQKAS